MILPERAPCERASSYLRCDARSRQVNFGAFGVALICPLVVLAVKDAVAWALRRHLPRLLRQRFLQLELADRINALFSQLFDPQGYFSRQVGGGRGHLWSNHSTFLLCL